MGMIFQEIAASLAASRFFGGVRSPLFAVCFALGFLGLALPQKALPSSPHAIAWFVLAPFIEELSWRAIMQNELEAILPHPGGPLSLANLLTSLAFAAAHVVIAPGLMPALTFFPSLCFGAIWRRFRSLWLCGLLHLWYNAALRL